MQQTISEAARLYGKARSTIHRAIAAGRLSCSVRGDGVRVIQLSELIRLWGEPKHKPPDAQQSATSPDDATQQAMLHEMQAMRRELVALREEVAEMRRLPAPAPQNPEPKVTTEPPRNFADVIARFEERQH